MESVARRGVLKATGMSLIGGSLLASRAVDVGAVVQEPSADWQRTYGGSGEDAFHDFVQTADGGYLLVGKQPNPYTGLVKPWVIRTDAIGNPVTEARFAGDDDKGSFNTVVKVDDGSYFTAGRVGKETPHPNLMLLEVDDDGGLSDRWNTTGPDPGEIRSATLANDDGFVVVGRVSRSESDSEFPGGMIGKISPDGSMQWGQLVSGDGGEAAMTAIIPASDEGYIVAGYEHVVAESTGEEGDAGVVRHIDENGNTIWRTPFFDEEVMDRIEIFDVIQGPDGGYLNVGEVHISDKDSPDGFVNKLDSSGKIEWRRIYDKPEANGFRSGFFRGSYFVGGYNENPDNRAGGWLVVLAPDGSEEGQNDWGEAGDGFHALLDTAEGNEAFAGTKGGVDGWLVFDPDTDRTLTPDERTTATPTSSANDDGSLSELRITSATLPDTIVPEEPFDVGMTVENTGDEPLEPEPSYAFDGQRVLSGAPPETLPIAAGSREEFFFGGITLTMIDQSLAGEIAPGEHEHSIGFIDGPRETAPVTVRKRTETTASDAGDTGDGSLGEDTSGSTSDDSGTDRRRGFFSNSGEGPAFLSNVFNLTVLGFLLSVAGIIHQMIKGQ